MSLSVASCSPFAYRRSWQGYFCLDKLLKAFRLPLDKRMCWCVVASNAILIDFRKTQSNLNGKHKTRKKLSIKVSCERQHNFVDAFKTSEFPQRSSFGLTETGSLSHWALGILLLFFLFESELSFGSWFRVWKPVGWSASTYPRHQICTNVMLLFQLALSLCDDSWWIQTSCVWWVVVGGWRAGWMSEMLSDFDWIAMFDEITKCQFPHRSASGWRASPENTVSLPWWTDLGSFFGNENLLIEIPASIQPTSYRQNLGVAIETERTIVSVTDGAIFYEWKLHRSAIWIIRFEIIRECFASSATLPRTGTHVNEWMFFRKRHPSDENGL